MALRITLKPKERLIVGGAVISNGKTKSELTIENKVPVLRQKDIIGEKDANTLARQIYFVIQLMYIDEDNAAAHHKSYWDLVQKFLKAAPSALSIVDSISGNILINNFYKAVKQAKRLIEYENEIIRHV